jgi:DNA polymerase elongation subunit (family B)
MKFRLQNISNSFSKIQLFCREDDGSLKVIEDDSFISYYYEPTTDKEADAVSIFGESLRKIYCNNPSDIRKQRSPDAYEADVHYTKRYILDKIEAFEPSKPRILYMDTEVDCKELPHPKEDQKLDDPITVIRLYDNYTQKYKSWRLDKWKSEFEMLEDFCQTIKQISPDVIYFWNKEFDYYALYYRIGEDFPNKISPIGQNQWRNGFPMPSGISIVDLMGLYAKFTLHKKDSYALMNVANDELGYEIEEDFDFTDINVADEKNKLDVEKMWKLDEKLKITEYFDRIRIDTRSLWEDLPSEMRNYQWQSNNSKVIDMLALAEAKKLGVVLPSKKQEDEQEEYDVEGAFRWLDRTGLFFDVSDVDLSGAYPQAIIDFCLSPENFTDKPEENTIKIDILTRENREYKTTYYVRQNPHAILPSLVKKLLAAKNELKYKLEATDKNAPEYEQLEISYATKKALTNTAYGVILLRYFRLFDVRVGETITFLIRDLLNFSKQKLAKANIKSIYFDTDGIIIQGKENITPQLNDWAVEWAMDKYQNEKIDITFEQKGYFSSIFIQGMCRYRGRLETLTGQKVETKGIQMKRKDVGVWVKKFQEELYDKILDGENKENILKFINEKIVDMKQEDLRRISIPVKINKKTEDYKTTPKWLIPLQETQKLVPEFNQTIGSRFYIVYCKNVEKLALSNKYFEHIKKDNIDWDSMLEKNIFNILVPIFKGLNWPIELLNLAEENGIILGSIHRNTLLENLPNFEELKEYYSSRNAKKRINEKNGITEPKKMVRKKIKDKPLKEKKLKKIEGSISAINSKKDNPS